MPNEGKYDKLKIDELNQYYLDAESADSELFSEQRSNIQLSAGEHYAQRNTRFWSRVRDNKQLNNDQKLRLTKNHLYRIVRGLVNEITNQAPGVTVGPKNESEIQDQKAAQLNLAVWEDIKSRHNFRKQILTWAKDFIEVGECAVKIIFDPSKGELVGYEAEFDENGQPLIDETGQMVASKIPIMGGDFVFERVLGFNLLRDPSAKTMEDCRYMIVRKMVDINDLKLMVKGDEEKTKMIVESSKDVYTVFDGSRGGYNQSKNMTMLREYYFKPCASYPDGYFYISTEQGVLWEGTIPLRIFPIVYSGYDEIATTPRHRSVIKQLRPYQGEINRSASKMAEHQITLGDDKLLIQQGTRIQNGGRLPGVRAITFSGQAPTFLSGRSGEQYMNYMNSQISEMYIISGIEEEKQEKSDGNVDPYAILYKSLRQKKKFSLYAEKFENFLVELCEKSLKLAKYYYEPYNLVPAIGRNEIINIEEFKKTEPLSYRIKLEPQQSDIETKMGKQLVFNHVLQYVGPQLKRDDIGKILRAMPYTNSEDAFKDFTTDYDNVTNDILAMDRGQFRQPHRYDNHEYVVNRLVNRMKQSDFEYLNPQIQQMYQQKLQMHEKMLAEQQEKIQAAKDGYIPSGGYLVTCDFYVEDVDSGKPKRVRVPYESLRWLLDRMKTQGVAMKDLENMQQGALQDIAQIMLEKQQMGQSMGSQMGMPEMVPQ